MTLVVDSPARPSASLWRLMCRLSGFELRDRMVRVPRSHGCWMVRSLVDPFDGLDRHVEATLDQARQHHALLAEIVRFGGEITLEAQCIAPLGVVPGMVIHSRHLVELGRLGANINLEAVASGAEDIDVAAFVELLIDTGPAMSRIAREHLASNQGEVLLHPLMSDVLRFCIERFEGGEPAELDRCLNVLAKGLTHGDYYVDNAVAVSFVENAQAGQPEMDAFYATWPAPLRAEANRQRDWRPDHR